MIVLLRPIPLELELAGVRPGRDLWEADSSSWSSSHLTVSRAACLALFCFVLFLFGFSVCFDGKWRAGEFWGPDLSAANERDSG